MILELADLRIRPGTQAEFEDAVILAIATVVSKAKGFSGYELHHGIESPERYVLHVLWETLEDHTVGFRESPARAEWRAIVGPFFAAPPVVEHFALVARSDGPRA